MATERAVIETIIVGGPQVVSTLDAESAATTRLERATERAGLAMQRTARRGFLMTQALFTMRRLTYMFTLGIVASTVALAKWGFDFNSQFQKGQLSLTKLLHGSKAANIELDKLFNLAATTPFQFKDMITAGTTMIAFGFSVNQTNRALRDLSDVLVGTNKVSPAALNRISQALGHMMSIGHATGQVLQQLARDGIPNVYEAIKQYFHLTPAQMARGIGALHLPADQVLKAIETYIEGSSLHGLAAKSQNSTLSGVFSSFKDYASRIMGDIEKRPFNFFQRTFARINPVLARMEKGFRTGGFKGMWDALTQGKPNGVERDLELLGSTLERMWRILTKSLIPAISFWFKVLKPVLAILLVLNQTLGWFAHHSTVTKLILIALIGEYIRLKIAVLRLWMVTKIGIWKKIIMESFLFWKQIGELIVITSRMIYWQLRLIWVTRAQIIMTIRAKLTAYAAAFALKFQTLWAIKDRIALIALRIATWGLVVATAAWEAILAILAPTLAIVEAEMIAGTAAAEGLTFGMIGAFVASTLLAAGAAALAAVMAILPSTWIALGIIALSVALYELIVHFDAVKTWVRHNWVAIGTALLGPVFYVGVMVFRVFERVKDKIANTAEWIVRKARHVWHVLKSIFNPFGIFNDPGANLRNKMIDAQLAQNRQRGMSMIPQLNAVHLPGNSTLAPISGGGIVPTQSFMPNGITITAAPVHLDGKKVAEVVFKHKDDVRARR